MTGYFAYNDGNSFFGENIRRNGGYGKPISKELHEKLKSLPNRGLRVAMLKRS
jgi:hypothetical protein